MSAFIHFINSCDIKVIIYYIEKLITNNTPVSISPMAQEIPATMQVDAKERKFTLTQVQKKRH
jgi:hypothetical protein